MWQLIKDSDGYGFFEKKTFFTAGAAGDDNCTQCGAGNGMEAVLTTLMTGATSNLSCGMYCNKLSPIFYIAGFLCTVFLACAKRLRTDFQAFEIRCKR